MRLWVVERYKGKQVKIILNRTPLLYLFQGVLKEVIHVNGSDDELESATLSGGDTKIYEIGVSAHLPPIETIRECRADTENVTISLDGLVSISGEYV